MKTIRILLFTLSLICGRASQIHAQGYIVPNGVETNTYPGEINVWNPSGTQATTFSFNPFGKQQPTVYTNVFTFNEPLSFGVRVFLVQSNEAITLQPILSGAWSEFTLLNNYVLAEGAPFYVALYTGNNFAPPYPPTPPFTYLDPVFGWALLVNNHGSIQLLDSALAYQSGGIYAGTQTLIPVPEPGTLALIGLGGLLLAGWRWKNNCGFRHK